MKVIFTLVFIFITIIVNSQVDSGRAKSIPFFAADSDQPKSQNAEVRLTCKVGSSSFGREPLIVVDGIPYEFGELKKLNPDDIESITILKEAAAAAIYSCRAAPGVIIIATKSSSVRKFIIKDFLTDEKIPAATICFTSDKDKIEEVADNNGILSTDKLKKGVKYHVTITSAGYKALRTIAAGNEQEVLLERDVKICDEVVVIAYPVIRCRRSCTHTYSKTTKCSLKTDTVVNDKVAKLSGKTLRATVYPNPVQRNNSAYFEFSNDQDETMQLNVFNLNGSPVLLQSEKISKGFNRISININTGWAAGIYIIQLKDKRGNILKYEKLIVQ